MVPWAGLGGGGECKPRVSPSGLSGFKLHVNHTFISQQSVVFHSFTSFAVHYEKICNHLRETATSSAKIHSLAQKYKYLGINQIQLRFCILSNIQ